MSRGLWRALEYAEVDRRERDSPLGRLGVAVLEISLWIQGSSHARRLLPGRVRLALPYQIR